jgi:hypothetical protein
MNVRGSGSRVVVGVLAIVGLTSCPAPPSTISPRSVTPDSVDRIVDYDHDAATGTNIIELEGSTIELPSDAVSIHGRPVHDGLLLSGEPDGQRWDAVLPARDDDGCFRLQNGSALNEGPTVLFPVDDVFGLRLEKGVALVESERVGDVERVEEEQRHPFVNWCIDADGLVQGAEYGVGV